MSKGDIKHFFKLIFIWLRKILCYNIRGSTAADNTCGFFFLFLNSIIYMACERQEQMMGKSEENSEILFLSLKLLFHEHCRFFFHGFCTPNRSRTGTDKLRLNYIKLDKEGDDVYNLHRTCPGPMLRLQGILHSNQR